MSEGETAALVLEHLPRARALGFLLRGPLSADDARQEAAVAVCRGAREYAPERGAQFQTFVASCVRNHLQNLKRDLRNVMVFVSGHELSGNCDDETGIVAVAPEKVSSSGEQMELRAALDELTPTVRAALELRFNEDATYEEIGLALGVSRRTAAALVAAGLDRLRRRMG